MEEPATPAVPAPTPAALGDQVDDRARQFPARAYNLYRLGRRWFDGPGRFSFVLAPVAGLAGVLFAIPFLDAAEEMCGFDDACMMGEVPLLTALTAPFFLAVVACAATLGVRHHRWRFRQADRSAERRIDALKEWFIRGDVDEADFLALRQRLKHPIDPLARRGTEVLTWARAGLFLVGAWGLVWTIAGFGFFVDESVEIGIGLLAGPGLPALVLAGVGARASSLLGREVNRLSRRWEEDLETFEDAIFRRSRARRGLGPPAPTAAPAPGPTFERAAYRKPRRPAAQA